jgi:outer membrane biosynthesis protein TonB
MRYTLIILFLIVIAGNQSFGQVSDTSLKMINTGNSLELSYRVINEKGESIPVAFVEEESESFPGGWDSLLQFIHRKLIYPKSAIDDNYQGKVFTKFTVNCNGEVGNIEILRGVRYDLDSACFHVVSIFPRFKPFKFPGYDKILIQYLLPITFTLTN